MIVCDILNKAMLDALPAEQGGLKNLFVLCPVSDIPAIQAAFHFDGSTILECTDLDESVRFASFDGYDFISLVYIELQQHKVKLSEINIYVSADYVVLVIPDSPYERLAGLESKMIKAVTELKPHSAWTGMVVYQLFNIILSELSDMLEGFEDDVIQLQEQIIGRVEKGQFKALAGYRHTAYIIKKQLRSSSYLGAQMLVDPNGLIHKDHRRYYNNIDTRLRKLYDFAANISELCNQLLISYDSRLTMKTNDIVNKLTILTVFFGPLTVITGIYGMNFDFMPELNHPLGYPAALALMAAVSGIIYWRLKKNKWL